MFVREKRASKAELSCTTFLRNGLFRQHCRYLCFWHWSYKSKYSLLRIIEINGGYKVQTSVASMWPVDISRIHSSSVDKMWGHRSQTDFSVVQSRHFLCSRCCSCTVLIIVLLLQFSFNSSKLVQTRIESRGDHYLKNDMRCARRCSYFALPHVSGPPAAGCGYPDGID